MSEPVEGDNIFQLNSVSAYEYIQALYRLCLVQSGSRAAAERAVHDTMVEAFRTANRELGNVDFDALFRAAFHRRNSYTSLSESDLTDWPRRLHSLSEPQRSTLTLFYLEILSPAFIAEIAGTSLEQLAETIREARTALGEARQ